MPSLPPSRCPIPGCVTFTPKGSLCETHIKERGAKRRKEETWRDYGKVWQAIRKDVLSTSPLCVSCGDIANEVDHIKPLRNGGTHDRENLRPLCKPCHSRRTYSDNLGKR